MHPRDIPNAIVYAAVARASDDSVNVLAAWEEAGLPQLIACDRLRLEKLIIYCANPDPGLARSRISVLIDWGLARISLDTARQMLNRAREAHNQTNGPADSLLAAEATAKGAEWYEADTRKLAWHFGVYV